MLLLMKALRKCVLTVMILMFNIPEVIVVEGNHDKARLKQVEPSLDIVITNGREISEDTLDLLKTLHQTRGIILMMDPDAPGEVIRKKIESHVGTTKHIFLPKHACIDKRKGKIGIEHASLSVLKEALMHHTKQASKATPSLTVADLTALGLSGTKRAALRRKHVGRKLHIGESNTKTFLRRLTMFGISKATLEKVIE